jgi:hypothetical protein
LCAAAIALKANETLSGLGCWDEGTNHTSRDTNRSDFAIYHLGMLPHQITEQNVQHCLL